VIDGSWTERFQRAVDAIDALVMMSPPGATP